MSTSIVIVSFILQLITTLSGAFVNNEAWNPDSFVCSFDDFHSKRASFDECRHEAHHQRLNSLANLYEDVNPKALLVDSMCAFRKTFFDDCITPFFDDCFESEKKMESLSVFNDQFTNLQGAVRSAVKGFTFDYSCEAVGGPGGHLP